jgi:hypothetical protein
MLFKEQAENCRRQAIRYAGRPEAPFLLRVASAFDELATDTSAMAQLDRRASAEFPSNIRA